MRGADIIIKNAKIFTATYTSRQVEACTITGQFIDWVGNNKEVGAWQTPDTRIIDAQGATLMPGFIDSHFHLLWGARQLSGISLQNVHTIEEVGERVQQYAQQHPAETWLMGRMLPYAALPDYTLTRHQLDAWVADRPLLLLSYDVHTAWANTEALKRGKMLHGGVETGPNSEIVMAADGLAHGELREPGAYDLLLKLAPPLTAAQETTLMEQTLHEAVRYGLTSVHNMDGDVQQLETYMRLEQAGKLNMRIYLPFHFKPEMPSEALAEALIMREIAQRSRRIRGGAVKFFMDGVIETYTGLLVQGYADRPSSQGEALFSAQQFNQLATEADRLGLQIAVHATGDGAVQRTLDGFEAAQWATKRSDNRHRIEHIELLHPTDVPRFAELGVIASMQPAHLPLLTDGDPWPHRIPPSRWGDSFAWETLRQAKAHLIFGSDWPVATMNPLVGVDFAINRQPWAEGLPDQRQTLTDALLCYTRQAAYAEFQEHVKGQIKPGMLADMVLLSDDIFAIPPEQISQVKPVLTICDGKIMYENL